MNSDTELAAFSVKLYKLMLDRKLRQTDLARLMGVRRDLISLYVRGRAVPSGMALADLAKALDVQPEELVPNGGLSVRYDIVEWLRDLGDHASYEPHAHHKAADEIERLRAALTTARADAIDEVLEELDGLHETPYSLQLVVNKCIEVVRALKGRTP